MAPLRAAHRVPTHPDVAILAARTTTDEVAPVVAATRIAKGMRARWLILRAIGVELSVTTAAHAASLGLDVAHLGRLLFGQDAAEAGPFDAARTTTWRSRLGAANTVEARPFRTLAIEYAPPAAALVARAEWAS